MKAGIIVEIGERNSGLIRQVGVKEHLFFHSDALVDVSFQDLKPGDKIVFKITESRKGPYAVEVRRA